MKSIIDNEETKARIFEAIDKALKECARQHNSNIEMIENNNFEPTTYNPSKDPRKQPVKLSIELMFNFADDWKIYCNPIVEL